MISPSADAGRLARERRPILLILAKYDMTFLPDLALIFFDDCDRYNAPARKVSYPAAITPSVRRRSNTSTPSTSLISSAG
jgi:hypothetical protein